MVYNKKFKFWLVFLLCPLVAQGTVLGGYGDSPSSAAPTSASSAVPAFSAPSNQSTSAPMPRSRADRRDDASAQQQSTTQDKAIEAKSSSSSANNDDDGSDDEDEEELDELALAQKKYEQALEKNTGEGEQQRINADAFDMLLNQALPLSPDQIKTLRRLYDISQQATAATPQAPPTPLSSSLRVNLEPGNTPPLIRLAAGFVSSLVFIDSTGSPWPITSYSLGDPNSFNIQWDQRSNTLFMQSLKLYSHGNLAVRLQGLNTPIMITVVSGQKQVDFRIDLQVAGRGPEASAPISNESLQAAQVNPLLINILDGIPPTESIKLEVSGQHGEAWLHNNRVYLRTKLTILSPAWTGTVSSPDGMHVYEMMKTPSILASKDGKAINIQLIGL